MSTPLSFLPLSALELRSRVSIRPGEVKLGERLLQLGTDVGREGWERARREGARYAVLGIPEDLGPRANLGRPGAEGAWEAFLAFFLNQQAHGGFPEHLLLAGKVQVQDLQEASRGLGSTPADLARLRDLCAVLDQRVAPVIEEVVAAGLIPIVIGGGHNNALPILRGTMDGLLRRGTPPASGLAVVNCDPHADFRLLEGRHSGNPFTYARESGLLASYFVLGLHEGYTSEEMLQRQREAGGDYVTWESLFARRELGFAKALERASDHARASGAPVGLELDLDAVAGMPSSAQAPNGLTCEEAAWFVHHLASRLPVAWLHLPEAAPSLGGEGGSRLVGKTLALLVSTFVKACQGRPLLSSSGQAFGAQP